MLGATLFICAPCCAAVAQLIELVLNPFDWARGAGCGVIGCGHAPGRADEGDVGFERRWGEAGFAGTVLREGDPADGGEDEEEEEEEEKEAPATSG